MRSTGQVNNDNFESLKCAMRPIIAALIDTRLLRDPDVDVNISVACCISEVIRTVVSYKPYNNEQIKDFFELVVITLEKLSSASRRCYPKMTMVFELLSDGKFSVPVYDMQQHGLITRLFEQFFIAADFNSTAVVPMIKKIMTKIIRESKSLNSELVELLVRRVRRENQSPSSRRLGGDVLKHCAAQLKPYLPDRMINEFYNFLGETIPSTTDHKRKLDCLEGSSNPIRRCQDANRHTGANNVNNSSKLECQEGIRNTVQPVTNYQHGTRDIVNLQGIHSENERTYEKRTLSLFNDLLMPSKPVEVKGKQKALPTKVSTPESDEDLWCPKDTKNFQGAAAVSDYRNKRLKMEQDMPKKLVSPQFGTVSVQGYKVKKVNASTLEEIFRNYGDIAADCIFKIASVRDSILEVVCDVARQILTNDITTIISEMAQIESLVSAAEANKINVSWLRAHLESIHKRNNAKKNYSLLMKTKANASLVSRAARMDVKSAKERLEKAERRVKVLNLVEKKLHDNLLESKAEKDSWAKRPILFAN